MKEIEVLVIGGGPAGLCAAINAAELGAKVLMCERDDVPGGQLVKQTHKFFGSEKQYAGDRGYQIGEMLVDKCMSNPIEKNFGWTISPNGLPINISNAHLKPGNYTIDGSRTSQVITGMVFALSVLPASSTITVESPSSTGYIFLTIEIAKQAGAYITAEQKANALEINIQGNTHYKASFNVDGDWSNAAFLIAAGLTNGETGISGLNPLSQQPDRAIMDILDICNANYEWKGNSLFVSKSKIGSFQFDATDTPDLIPPLCILTLNADSECKIYGANRLIGKESNRLDAIVTELGKLGADIKTDGNCITTQPLKNIPPALLDSHNDHRIAMMLAVLGLSSDEIRIKGCECVEKSYPDFFEILKQLGGIIINDR